MSPSKLSLEDRQARLDYFLTRFTKRGFQFISRSPSSAELYRPARFPTWLFKPQTIFIDIDDIGRIYVNTVWRHK